MTARAASLGTAPPVPSFEEVYAAHAAFVIRNLRRLGVSDAALDDAAQDVFVVVHRRLPEFEGRSAITTWLFAIVVGVARNQRRSRRRRAPENEGEPETDGVAAAPADRPDRRAEQAQSVRVLMSLLDELDEDKREAFVLSQLEQMTAPEIAEALHLNVNTVYARIRASIQAFEQAVARHRAREASSGRSR
jgi:RNA polymerase sigma-70 factor (ECF subfamily)